MRHMELPTHAEEVDVLRLHVAKLKMERLQEQCAAAVAEFARQLNEAEAKYGFRHADGEGINLDTRKILRAPVKSDG